MENGEIAWDNWDIGYNTRGNIHAGGIYMGVIYWNKACWGRDNRGENSFEVPYELSCLSDCVFILSKHVDNALFSPMLFPEYACAC